MAPAVRPGGRPLVQIVCRRLWTLVHLWPGFCRPQATLGTGPSTPSASASSRPAYPQENGVFAERITKWGRSGREQVVGGGLILEREGGVPRAEGGRELAVECPRPDLEQEVRAFRCPLHRLLLAEALAEQRI